MGPLLLGSCSTWTFCLGLVSVKVMGYEGGRSVYVILLIYWDPGHGQASVVIWRWVWEPLTLKPQLGNRVALLAFRKWSALIHLLSRDGLGRSAPWATAGSQTELRCGKPCEPTVFSYSLMDIHCVCLCTRCGFESCKMMTLLCCALVSLALPKLTLVVRESSRSVPSFRYTGKCSTKFFHFQLFFFFYLPMKNPKYKISYLS